MNTFKKFLKISTFAILTILTLAQCTEETPDPTPADKGEVSFEMTDAPIDDPNVESVFITVAEVRIDGEVYDGFSGKQTIDILAYQNGETKALGLGELETGTYTDISLVLDYETDANGNAPGCYVLTTDDVKHELNNSANSSHEFFLDKDLTIMKDMTTTLVMDFDVRKAIQYNDQNEFSFVTTSEMENSIRVADKGQSGEIEGKVDDNMSNSDKIVVYAYKKGTFNQNTETTGQGQSNIEFKNAVTSAVVDAEGNFTLAFLEEGDYEVHCIGYKDTDNDGRLEANSMLEVSSLLSLDVLGLSITSSTSLTLNLSVVAVNPI